MMQSSLSLMDWLAVASSIVVLGLFAQHAHEMAGYPRLVILFDSVQQEQTLATKTILSDHCHDAVERFKNVTSQQQQTKSQDHNQQKYTTFYQEGGFCARIPARLSPAKLWNDQLGRILRAATTASNNENNYHDHHDEMAAHLITSQLLRFLTPNSYLQLGVRAPPMQMDWGKFLEKVQARLERGQDAPMVQVVVLGATASGNGQPEGEEEWCDLPWITDAEEEGDDANFERRRRLEDDRGVPNGNTCHWPFLLARLVNNLLVGQSNIPVVNVTVIAHPGYTATSELATAMVQHDLWPPHLHKHGGPDVIVNAYASQDMYLPARGYEAAADVGYYHHQRTITQDFIRACLLRPKACSKNNNDIPLVVHLNDYVGGQHGAVLSETIKARALQQMSDFYGTALVSYATLIQPLVYATSSPSSEDEDEDSALQDMGNMDDDNAEDHSQQSLLLQQGWTRQMAITIIMAYSFLQYTVQYCASEESERQRQPDLPSEPMVPAETFQLIRGTVPPELNLDLCLGNVTALWKQEQERQQQLEASGVCPKSSCELAFWGATDTLDMFIKENVGWNVQKGEPLVAQEQGALLRLGLHLHHARSGTAIRLFTVRQDGASSLSRLRWEIISGNGHGRHRRRGRRLEQQQSDGWKKSGFINGTHDSPAFVAVPHVIQLKSEDFTLNNHSSTVDLKLELVEGDYFEVVAMMIC